MDIQGLREALNLKKGRLNQIEQDLKRRSRQLRHLTLDRQDFEKALAFCQKVAQDTQQKLEFHISNLCTLALSGVFDDPYEVKVAFVIRKGKTEADITFLRGEDEIDPMTASGGGAVDIAAFALRLASWSMERTRKRNTIILDEPFRFLSKDLHPKAAEMMKQLTTSLSKKTGLQFIMVTHSQALIEEGTDQIFEVGMEKDKDGWAISQIKEGRRDNGS